METTFLKLVCPINEDLRTVGRTDATGAVDKGPSGIINKYDWRVWNGAAFGRQLQGMLRSGGGYNFEVTDMGQYVACRASYHCVSTGKSISKVFIVAFDNPKLGDGKVFATSTKWRTISTVQQAANYINSAIRSYQGWAESGN